MWIKFKCKTGILTLEKKSSLEHKFSFTIFYHENIDFILKFDACWQNNQHIVWIYRYLALGKN